MRLGRSGVDFTRVWAEVFIKKLCRRIFYGVGFLNVADRVVWFVGDKPLRVVLIGVCIAVWFVC